MSFVAIWLYHYISVHYYFIWLICYLFVVVFFFQIGIALDQIYSIFELNSQDPAPALYIQLQTSRSQHNEEYVVVCIQGQSFTPGVGQTVSYTILIGNISTIRHWKGNVIIVIRPYYNLLVIRVESYFQFSKECSKLIGPISLLIQVPIGKSRILLTVSVTLRFQSEAFLNGYFILMQMVWYHELVMMSSDFNLKKWRGGDLSVHSLYSHLF